LSVDEVDSITGPLIGRPKSATFRTLDVVGLDTFISVAKNVRDQVEGDEKKVFEIPEFVEKMNENGWISAKAKQGFYYKKKTKEGSQIFQINPETLEYEERGKLKTAAVKWQSNKKARKRKCKRFFHRKAIKQVISCGAF